MKQKEYLTEDEVIQGVENYLSQKGLTLVKRTVSKAQAATRDSGIDLVFKLENKKKNGNFYYIEAKGNKRSDGRAMHSRFRTNFLWAISQIILRIKYDPRNYNKNYGIAVPQSEIKSCIHCIHDNWALKHLKIRLYGAYYDPIRQQLTAIEYLPKDIYDKKCPASSTADTK